MSLVNPTFRLKRPALPQRSGWILGCTIISFTAALTLFCGECFQLGGGFSNSRISCGGDSRLSWEWLLQHEISRQIHLTSAINQAGWFSAGGLGGGSTANFPILQSLQPLMVERNVEAIRRSVRLRLNRLQTLTEIRAQLPGLPDELLQLGPEFAKCIPDIPPVQGGYIGSDFGIRRDPFRRDLALHKGLDIVQDMNSDIVATAEGAVVEAGWREGYGRSVLIDHGFGLSTFYAHLRKIEVRAGDRVNKGQRIGSLGNSGRSTGPHVHYEIHLEGRAINPEKFLKMR